MKRTSTKASDDGRRRERGMEGAAAVVFVAASAAPIPCDSAAPVAAVTVGVISPAADVAVVAAVEAWAERSKAVPLEERCA